MLDVIGCGDDRMHIPAVFRYDEISSGTDHCYLRIHGTCRDIVAFSIAAERGSRCRWVDRGSVDTRLYAIVQFIG